MNVMRIHTYMLPNRDNEIPGYIMSSWDLLISQTVHTIYHMVYTHDRL